MSDQTNQAGDRHSLEGRTPATSAVVTAAGPPSPSLPAPTTAQISAGDRNASGPPIDLRTNTGVIHGTGRVSKKSVEKPESRDKPEPTNVHHHPSLANTNGIEGQGAKGERHFEDSDAGGGIESDKIIPAEDRDRGPPLGEEQQKPSWSDRRSPVRNLAWVDEDQLPQPEPLPQLEPRLQVELQPREEDDSEPHTQTHLNQLSDAHRARIAENMALAVPRATQMLHSAQRYRRVRRADQRRLLARERSEEPGLDTGSRAARLAAAARAEARWIMRLYGAQASPVAWTRGRDSFVTQRLMREHGLWARYPPPEVCTVTGALFFSVSGSKLWLLDDEGQHVFAPRLVRSAEGPGY